MFYGPYKGRQTENCMIAFWMLLQHGMPVLAQQLTNAFGASCPCWTMAVRQCKHLCSHT